LVECGEGKKGGRIRCSYREAGKGRKPRQSETILGRGRRKSPAVFKQREGTGGEKRPRYPVDRKRIPDKKKEGEKNRR